MARQHIKWTDEEWDLVARCIANHLADNPGATLPAAYSAISHNLKDRVRIMNSAKSFDPIVDRIKKLMRKKKDNKEDKQDKNPVKIKIIDRHIASSIKDFSTEQLQSELYRRSLEPMLKEMAELLSHKVVSNISSSLTNNTTNELVNNISKHCLLIVGLLPEQENEIKSEYKEFYNLKFYKDKKLSNLSDLCKNADTAILMTKFISHNHQDIVKNNNVPIVWCNGGMSDLKEILESMYSNF